MSESRKRGKRWYSEADKKRWVDQNPFPADAISLEREGFGFRNEGVHLTVGGDLAVKMTQDTWILMDNDSNSVELLRAYRWSFCKGYARAARDGNTVQLHQLVLERATPRPNTASRLIVDHRNGNTLDDRLSNLRWATASQNSFNRPLRGTSNTGHRNISWLERDSAYVVSLVKPDPMESELAGKVVCRRFSTGSCGSRELAFVGALRFRDGIYSEPEIKSVLRDRF